MQILNIRFLVIIFFFLLFNSLSCRKTASNQTVNQIEFDLIKRLKESINEKKENKSIYDAAYIDTLLNQSNWQNGIKINASDGKVLIFVPTISNNVGLEFFYDKTKNSIDSTNLIKVISSQKNDIKQTMNAIESYYELVLLKRNPNLRFSGKIQAFSISSKYKYSYSFQDDLVINRGIVAPVPKKELNQIRSNEIKNTNERRLENCELWGHFTIWSDGRTTLDYTYYVCTCDVNTSLNLKSGDTFIKSSCGGGGGDPNLINDVKVEIKDTCLKKVIEYLLTRTVFNSITDILTNVFSVNNKINLTFKEDPNLMKVNGKPVEGRTSSYPFQNSQGGLNIDIFINPTLFYNTSQEYRAAIIMHEIIHASFRYNYSFPGYNGDQYGEILQHYDMLNNYLVEMTYALVSIFGMPEKDAVSLSLYGIGIDELINNKVIKSDGFNKIIKEWGLNSDPLSRDFWQFSAQAYEREETKGIRCISNNISLGDKVN